MSGPIREVYRVGLFAPVLGVVGLLCTVLLVMRSMDPGRLGASGAVSPGDLWITEVLPIGVGLGGASLTLLWMVRLRAVICDWGIAYRGMLVSARLPWALIVDVRRDAKGLTLKVKCGEKWFSLVNLSCRGQDLDQVISAALKAKTRL